MIELSPTLDEIEHKLFAPSIPLLLAWEEGSLDEQVIQELESDPYACEVRSRFQITPEDDLVDATSDGPADTQLPANLLEAIRAVDLKYSSALQTPCSGQLIALDDIYGPDEPLHYDLQTAPVLLLLKCVDTRVKNNVWIGWVVGSETDYAAFFDVVLQEGDVSQWVDHDAAMVQVWNQIEFCLPAKNRVLGSLTDSCMSAIRAVAKEYQSAFAPDDDPAQAIPGHVGMRDVFNSDCTVVSGTYLGDESMDPRWSYRKLYLDSAAKISAGVELHRSFDDVSEFYEEDDFQPSLVEDRSKSGPDLAPVIPFPQPSKPTSINKSGLLAACFVLSIAASWGLYDSRNSTSSPYFDSREKAFLAHAESISNEMNVSNSIGYGFDEGKSLYSIPFNEGVGLVQLNISVEVDDEAQIHRIYEVYFPTELPLNNGDTSSESARTLEKKVRSRYSGDGEKLSWFELGELTEVLNLTAEVATIQDRPALLKSALENIQKHLNMHEFDKRLPANSRLLPVLGALLVENPVNIQSIKDVERVQSLAQDLRLYAQ